MKDYSDIIDFVSKDTDANAKSSGLRFVLAAVLIVVPLLFLLIFGTNERLGWQVSWEFWSMCALLAVGIFAFVQALFSPRVHRSFWIFAVVILATSFVLPFFSTAFIVMQGAADFWRDALHCFLFGAVVSGVTAVLLATLVYRKGPVPSRETRTVLNIAGALSGVVTLFFNCSSADLSHLFVGHFVQFVLLFGLNVLLNEWLLGRLVKSKLGSAAAQFRDLSSFDKR